VAPNNDRSQLESGGSSLRLETPSYKAGSFETNVCQFQLIEALPLVRKLSSDGLA
jgi:hypothetical protein